MDTIQKRQLVVVYLSAFVLMIPLIAMQFTNEVNWVIGDFIVAGGLLIGASLLGEWVLRKIHYKKYRIAALFAVVLMLLLIWAELAVGIFGSPIAGS